MTEDEEKIIRARLQGLERTGVHPPRSAESAYLDHVTVLLDALDGLRWRAQEVLKSYQDGDTRGLKIDMDGLHRELHDD